MLKLPDIRLVKWRAGAVFCWCSAFFLTNGISARPLPLKYGSALVDNASTMEGAGDNQAETKRADIAMNGEEEQIDSSRESPTHEKKSGENGVQFTLKKGANIVDAKKEEDALKRAQPIENGRERKEEADPPGQHHEEEERGVHPPEQHHEEEERGVHPPGEHHEEEERGAHPPGQHHEEEERGVHPPAQHHEEEERGAHPPGHHHEDEERGVYPPGQHHEEEERGAYLPESFQYENEEAGRFHGVEEDSQDRLRHQEFDGEERRYPSYAEDGDGYENPLNYENLPPYPSHLEEKRAFKELIHPRPEYEQVNDVGDDSLQEERALPFDDEERSVPSSQRQEVPDARYLDDLDDELLLQEMEEEANPLP